MKKFSPFVIIFAIATLTFAGCATQTSGPTLPGTQAGSHLSKLIGQNVLLDDPTVLQLYVAADCNVAAAQEYRASLGACSGNLAALAGGAIIPANLVTAVQDLCQVLGYTDQSNQLLASLPKMVVPGPPDVCLQPVAKIAAPLGQSLKPLMPPLISIKIPASLVGGAGI